MRERISVHNYGAEPADVRVELRGDVDFADLFEVKENRVLRQGGPPCEVVDHGLHFAHDAGPVHKVVEILSADRAVAQAELASVVDDARAAARCGSRASR